MNLKQVLMRLNAVGYEYVQDVRKKMMNQVRDIVRKKDMGVSFDEVEDKKEKKSYGTKYNDSKLLGVANELIKQEKILPEEGKYILDFFDVQIPLISKLEKEYRKNMGKLVLVEPIYVEFLDKIRGIDKVLSAKLIKGFDDCSSFDTVSKLWAFCGQDVVNGKAPRRRKGETIRYNPKLKSLTWVVSDCLMKANKGYYRQIYDTEKEKQLNQKYPIGFLEEKYGKPYKKTDIKLSLGHAHNRALRKMRKIFLDHFWHASRELAGLPAKKNYVEGVLKHDHVVLWKKAIELEGKND